MIYLFNELEMVTEKTYLDWLHCASAQRRDQILRYKFHKDRLLCLLSYKLLCHALNLENVEFDYGQYGKPRLKHGGKHFNLTHCDGLVACIVSDRPVGIDAELLHPYPEEITERLFTPHENARIITSDDPDRIFFMLWTLKESYIKALGLGLQFPLLEVEFTLSDNSIRCSDPSWLFESHIVGKHILSYCAKEKHPVFPVSLEQLL